MAVIKYTRGKSVRLTRNFKSAEFDCKGKTCGCVVTRVDSKLARKLQILRNRAGGTITVNSGNRCAFHNRVVGGASSSYHLNTNGKAADIAVSGMTPAQAAKLAQEVGFTGVGCYTGSAGNFIHVDTRPIRYFWKNTGGRNITVSTHGGQKKSCPYKLGASTLRIGSEGESVRAMQWILDWAGYDCAVDGDFGGNTAAALRSFQRDMCLETDAVAGAKTLAALREVSQ